MAQAVRINPFEKGTRDLDAVTGKSPEGWVAGALIGVMLLSVTSSVSVSNWADGVSLTLYSVLAGLLFGALVTRLRLPGWLAHPLMLLEGAFITAFLCSSLVQPEWATWNEKLIIMELRLGRWASAVFSGGIGTDTLLFVMLLVSLAWAIGYVAAWSVFRVHQPWGAILPAGAALLLNLFYSPPQSGVFLMAFLLSGMLLLVRTTLLRREETWRRMSIRYASDIGFDFLTYGVIFSGVVILASWIVPPTAPGPEWVNGITNTVRGPWQDVSDNVSRMFSTVRQANTGGPTTMFGSSLSMGGPIHLGNRPVMDIQSSQGRYWRAVTFDRYTGVGWVTSANQSDGFNAGDTRIRIPPVSLTRELSQTVQILLPGDNLVVAASDPFQVSEPVTARYMVVQSAGGDSFMDIAQLRFQNLMRKGDVYGVLSTVSGADEEALRHATTDYPAFIRDRYLQLPNTVPSRVHDLAVTLTASATNNYDKARAIESYLRANIHYDDTVAAPPPDRDGVDYTLFDRPAGYCNYYASAMAVLAREIGIPSRIASGYATGESDNGIFHVNESNAHTWPELYFGNLGWIQFEPTASKPEIVRPVKRDETPTPNATTDPNADDALRRRTNPRNLDPEPQINPGGASNGFSFRLPPGPLGVLVATGSGGLVLLVLSGAVMQVAWVRRMRVLPPGARAWEELHRFARWVGFEDRAQATPLERADELARVMPDTRGAISDVTNMYVRERYGAQKLSFDESQRAGIEIKILRRRLFRSALEKVWRAGPVRLAEAAKRVVERISHSTHE